MYSDLGFIALAEVIGAVGDRLDRFCARRVFAPFGLENELCFFDLKMPIESKRPIAATGRTRPREPAPGQESDYSVHAQTPELHPGEVDDDNAWAMAGIAGHAGLFGSARALARFGWLLYEEIEGAKRWGSQSILPTLIQLDPAIEGSPRALGFDVPAKIGSAAGSLLGQLGPRGAIGHLGFTGCSLWIDLDRQLSIALCTNRTLVGREHGERFRPLRPAFHDAVVRAID